MADILVKDKECIHCEKFFECEGHKKGSLCINFKERKKDGKRRNGVL